MSRLNKTNKMTVHPAKTPISLGICPVWSESSLSAWRKLGSLATHLAHSEDSDQTGRMPRLICLRWAHTHFVGFVVSRLIPEKRKNCEKQKNLHRLVFELRTSWSPVLHLTTGLLHRLSNGCWNKEHNSFSIKKNNWIIQMITYIDHFKLVLCDFQLQSEFVKMADIMFTYWTDSVDWAAAIAQTQRVWGVQRYGLGTYTLLPQ